MTDLTRPASRPRNTPLSADPWFEALFPWRDWADAAVKQELAATA